MRVSRVVREGAIDALAGRRPPFAPEGHREVACLCPACVSLGWLQRARILRHQTSPIPFFLGSTSGTLARPRHDWRAEMTAELGYTFETRMNSPHR